MIRRLKSHLDVARLRRSVTLRKEVPTVRLGTPYGGWTIPVGLIDSESIVYSAGVGEDVSFDLELIARTACNVWAFDPTPRAIRFARDVRDPKFHFMPVGLWASDEVRRFQAPQDPTHVSHSTVSPDRGWTGFTAECRSIGSLMRELGHSRIDLLKLDIEGAEYAVLGSLGPALPTCICVELHPIVPRSEMLLTITSLEYEVIHVEGWNLTLVKRGSEMG